MAKKWSKNDPVVVGWERRRQIKLDRTLPHFQWERNRTLPHFQWERNNWCTGKLEDEARILRQRPLGAGSHAALGRPGGS